MTYSWFWITIMIKRHKTREMKWGELSPRQGILCGHTYQILQKKLFCVCPCLILEISSHSLFTTHSPQTHVSSKFGVHDLKIVGFLFLVSKQFFVYVLDLLEIIFLTLNMTPDSDLSGFTLRGTAVICKSVPSLLKIGYLRRSVRKWMNMLNELIEKGKLCVFWLNSWLEEVETKHALPSRSPPEITNSFTVVSKDEESKYTYFLSTRKSATDHAFQKLKSFLISRYPVIINFTLAIVRGCLLGQPSNRSCTSQHLLDICGIKLGLRVCGGTCSGSGQNSADGALPMLGAKTWNGLRSPSV